MLSHVIPSWFALVVKFRDMGIGDVRGGHGG
jgi:hypothetical protein